MTEAHHINRSSIPAPSSLYAFLCEGLMRATSQATMLRLYIAVCEPVASASDPFHEVANAIEADVRTGEISKLVGAGVDPARLFDLQGAAYKLLKDGVESNRTVRSFVMGEAIKAYEPAVDIPVHLRVIAAAHRHMVKAKGSARGTEHAATAEFLNNGVACNEPALDRFQVRRALMSYSNAARRWREAVDRPLLANRELDPLGVREQMDDGLFAALLEIRRRIKSDRTAYPKYRNLDGAALADALAADLDFVAGTYRRAGRADLEAGEPLRTIKSFALFAYYPPWTNAVRIAA